MNNQKKALIIVILLTLSCTPLSRDRVIVSPIQQNSGPLVKSSPTYDIIIMEDIIYASGLCHPGINRTGASVKPLKLDIYLPDNDLVNRPAFIFIHGGGFKGGSKKQNRIMKFANYFASRGWVFYSIDYRLMDDMGTVPEEWVEYSANIDEKLVPQFLAMYPAHRDAKAALRWVVSTADAFNINNDYITVGGASAGAITAISLGISNQEDFRDEIDLFTDSTLASTNLNQDYSVRTIIDLWGSKITLDALEAIDGIDRFEGNDPPMLVAHGIEDTRVPFSKAEELKTIYEANNLPLAYYPLEGSGHGAWNARVKGKALAELCFDFVVDQQHLSLD